jgi:hypothetical protein
MSDGDAMLELMSAIKLLSEIECTFINAFFFRFEMNVKRLKIKGYTFLQHTLNNYLFSLTSL